MAGLSETQIDIKDQNEDGSIVQISDFDDKNKKLSIVENNEVISDQKGILTFGSDGSNSKPLLTNDEGRLQVIIAAKDPNDVYVNLTSDSSGRLSVSTQPPTPPENTVPVVLVSDGTMNANTTLDTYYTITDGSELVIQRFNAGAVQTTGGNIVELYYDPDGSTPSPPSLGRS